MSGLQILVLIVLAGLAILLLAYPQEVKKLYARYKAYQYLNKENRDSFLFVTGAELLQAIERRAADLSTKGSSLVRTFNPQVPWCSNEILIRAGEAMTELINACKYGHSDWYHNKVCVVCDEALSVSEIERLPPGLSFELKMWARDVRDWAHVCHTLVGALVKGGALEKTPVVQKSWGQQS